MATTAPRRRASPGRKSPSRSVRVASAPEGERSQKPGRHTDYGDNDKYRARGSKLVETRLRAPRR